MSKFVVAVVLAVGVLVSSATGLMPVGVQQWLNAVVTAINAALVYLGVKTPVPGTVPASSVQQGGTTS